MKTLMQDNPVNFTDKDDVVRRAVREMVEALVGFVAGAALVSETEQWPAPPA